MQTTIKYINKTWGESQGSWALFPSGIQYLPFYHTTISGTGRMKELIKEEISTKTVCLYHFQSWPPNTNQY